MEGDSMTGKQAFSLVKWHGQEIANMSYGELVRSMRDAMRLYDFALRTSLEANRLTGADRLADQLEDMIRRAQDA